jgi:hypothetical protein
VDETAEEYKLLHPNIQKKKPSLVDEHFTMVSESEGDGDDMSHDGSDENNESSSDSEEDTGRLNKKRKQEKRSTKSTAPR